jgi:hypothetical protein
VYVYANTVCKYSYKCKMDINPNSVRHLEKVGIVLKVNCLLGFDLDKKFYRFLE